MNITVDHAGTGRFTLEVAPDMALGDLAVLLEVETDVAASAMRLVINGAVLDTSDSSATLQSKGIHEGTVVTVTTADALAASSAPTSSSTSTSTAASSALASFSSHPSSSSSAAAAGGAADPFAAVLQAMRQAGEESQLRAYRDKLRRDPYSMSLIKQHNPDFADAILGDDFAKFCDMVREQRRREQEERTRRADLERRLAENPFDIEAQRLLEEEIRQNNVEELRRHAVEHMPESFGSVIMLYIDVVVNGVPIKAFVDSGAQMTIMSKECAERCSIARLIDTRFAGVAVGVGSQRILGRVHMYQLQIGESHLPTSFSILENQPMDMLLGLDMLKRHQCVLDLKDMVLRIGTTGTSVPFLSESELPPSARREGGPPAVPQNAGGTSAAGSASTVTQFPQEVVAELLALGSFSPEQVAEALTVCGGDKAAAANYLLSMGSMA